MGKNSLFVSFLPKACVLAVTSGFMFLLFCPPAPAQEASEELGRSDTEEMKLFRLAGRLFEERNYPAAAKNYRDFTRNYPKHSRAPDAQMMLAECLYDSAIAEADSSQAVPKKIFREAEKEYRRALDVIPKDDHLGESAAFRLGEIEFNLKQYDEAFETFEKLLADYPGGLLRGEARLLQAQALLTRKKSAEAAGILRAVLADQPVYENDPRVSLAYGVALFETGKSSEALSQLEDLKNPLAYLYAGRALMSLGRPLVAVEKFKQVIESDPQGPWTELSRYFSAEAFFAAKDFLSAMQGYEQFLLAYPQSPLRPGTIYKIGLCQYERGEYLAARGSFQSVMQLSPGNEFAQLSLYMTGETFLREGRLKEAGFAYADMASSYETVLAGNAQFKLGWCHFKQGELPASETALRLMLTRFPAHRLTPAAGTLLGNVLTREERYRDAVRAYQQSLDLLETIELAEEDKTQLREADLALLNKANLLGGDYPSLVSGYQYVLNHFKPTLNPWRAATLLYIAEGYFRQELYDKALGIYTEILNSYPIAPESAFAADGTAWCLFKKGEYPRSGEEREKLSAYQHRPPVAPSKTVLAEGVLPEDFYISSEYEQAVALFNQKKYTDALDRYESFEKSHPNHPMAAQAAFWSGWCYYRLEYYGQAIKTWERVETSYPNSPVAVQSAWAGADTYFRAQQHEKAIAAYTRIIQTYSRDSSLSHARLRIAQSYYNGKDLPKAIAAFEELLREEPDSRESSQVLDFFAQLLDRPESKNSAIDALNRVADSRPGSRTAAQARFYVARNYYESGDHASAVKLLEGLVSNLTMGKELADAQFYLADSYYTLKRYSEASLAYERVTLNYPGDKRFPAALFHLGAARFKLNEYAPAAEAFGKLVKEYPSSSYAPVALFNSALAYRKLGKWEEAALALKTYVKNYPEEAKNSNASSELAAIYEEHRQFPLAAALLQENRDALPQDDALRAELTYRLAEDYSAMGDMEKAEAEYRALVKSPLKSNNFRLSALGKLGEYYEKKESWPLAVDAYHELAQSAVQKEWVEAAKARIAVIKEKLAQGAAVEVSTPAAAAPAAPQSGDKRKKQ